MIKRVEELNEKLEEKEFHLEVKEAFKNNGNKFGITVLSDNNKYKMCPTVYKECMEDIWHDDDKVIEFLERIYEENKDKKLDVKTLCSRDYILENVRLRVVSDANIGEVYRDFLKVKGVNLTVKELKKQNKEENLYDVEIIDEFFKDCDEDEKVLIAAQGWAEEKNGFTILFEETT